LVAGAPGAPGAAGVAGLADAAGSVFDPADLRIDTRADGLLFSSLTGAVYVRGLGGTAPTVRETPTAGH
jgi:hypothetical protein